MEKEHSKKSSSAFHAIYISIILILLIVIAGGFYYIHRNSEYRSMRLNSSVGLVRMGMRGGRGMAMVAVTPPPLSDQQNQQLTAGTSTTTTQKTFNITAGNFYFVPNKIAVNKGDQVTLYITNAGGVHDLVIDELGIKTPVAKTATTETYTFTASKSGAFVYYCSVPTHRQRGMWGTLVVQ